MTEAALPARVLPSKKVNQGVHTAKTRATELYPTPPELTAALLRAVTLPPVLWEPAAGLCHMSNALRGAGHTVHCSDAFDYGERYPIIDFLKTIGLPNPSVGAVITNPPFSLSADFVRHGLRLCPEVYILNRLAFLEGAARRDILDGPLAEVYPFVERPPMMHRHTYDPATERWVEWQGNKASSAMPVAWFVFRRGHDARRMGTQMKRLSWRTPKPSKTSEPVALPPAL